MLCDHFLLILCDGIYIYILLGCVCGVGTSPIIYHNLSTNLGTPVIVQAACLACSLITRESSLGFAAELTEILKHVFSDIYT